MAVNFDPLEFACDFEWLGIPHFWNVATNLPFLVLGVWGLLRLRVLAPSDPFAGAGWRGVWVSSVLLAFASGLYHWELERWTLGVDRVFVVAIAATIAGRAALVAHGEVRGRVLGWVFQLVAQGSVLFWWFGGTPLFYGALQAISAVYVLVVYGLATRRFGSTAHMAPLVRLVVFYAFAKLLEWADAPVGEMTGCIGGHPFKHVLAALGLAQLLPFMRQEIGALGRPSPTGTPTEPSAL